jgi:sialate O-acetylesterase
MSKNPLFRLLLVASGLVAIALGAAPGRADVRLPAIFSEHMVLQQGAVAPVWGWAEPGEKVTAAVGGQTEIAVADADGKWMVRFTNLKSGGPYTLTVKGKNSLSVGDVLVGEVWLGSGQSNMAMTVSGAKDFEKEKARADLPKLRMFTVTSGAASQPQTDCTGKWVVCSPQTVGGFSATLFFCGRELHESLGVPVGLIHSSVGGTPIELWISEEAQRHSPELKDLVTAQQPKPPADQPKSDAKPKAAAARSARAIGSLFNGKIAPLIPYALHGVLWYQGEANTHPGKSRYYRHQLPLLVQDWRKRWDTELPFAWVQLPNFERSGDGWMAVREAMLQTLRLPRTGMAIAIDIGEAKDIHPKNKQEVGHRLALWALGEVYGKKVPATSGPLSAGHEVRGAEIVLSFKYVDGGLQAKGGPLRGFAIAGEDRQWKPAMARIEGDKIVVSSPMVKQPVAVRYAWEPAPQCNLYNDAGLPASPFRTDDWPVTNAARSPESR